MSPGALAQVTPCRDARPLRGRTKPAKPSGMAMLSPVATIGPRTRDQYARLDGNEVTARVARVLGHGKHGVGVQTSDLNLHGRHTSPRGRSILG